MKSIAGKNALITGASSGIGYAMVKILAEKGVNVVIVARRKKKLEDLKKEILKNHKIEVEIIPADLSSRESPEKVYNEVKKRDMGIDILINNAGYGIHKYFINIPWEKQAAMLDLLIINLTHLTKLFVEDMVIKKSGYILNVASTGAFQPTPTYATYAAAKSYVLNFSVALNQELKGTGVKCSVLCPGATMTEFANVAQHEKTTAFIKFSQMTAEKVAKIAVKKMFKGRLLIIPGLFNSVNAKIVNLLPKTMAANIAASAMGKPQEE